MKKILKGIKDSWQYLSLICAIGIFSIGISKWVDDLTEIAKKNQQMSLKNTIWNENIPIQERTNACDTYLFLGYNSYTKKYCETVLLEEENLESVR